MSDQAGIPNVPAVDAALVAAEDLRLPEQPDVRFRGFGSDAFDVLEELRRRPTIDEYRRHKVRIKTEIQDPFKRYRDDLVVNWLLPNRIRLETEKNVFSRLLKNDFGAGGCHHHFWMSFYRPERSRLRDVQLVHSLWPDAFYIAVYIGHPIPKLFKRVHRRILNNPDEFLRLLNPLLLEDATELRLTYGRPLERRVIASPLSHLPGEFGRATEIAVRRRFSREDVLDLGPRLVQEAMAKVVALWPIYRYLLESVPNNS